MHVVLQPSQRIAQLARRRADAMRRVAAWLMCAAAAWAHGASRQRTACLRRRQPAGGTDRGGAGVRARRAGVRVQFTFGASGLLKDRIAAGERADVFASANMEHPQSLASAGLAGPVQRFTRNAMCALVAPTVDVTPDTLVDRLLDPATKVGTSTPQGGSVGRLRMDGVRAHRAAGPARRVQAARRQVAAAHRWAEFAATAGGPQRVRRARWRRGGPMSSSPTAPTRRWRGPNSRALRAVAVPHAINVSADYGVAPVRGAGPQAQRFVDYLLSPSAQAILARSGFAPP